ncbi:MAG: ketopantoate reductase family protein, partial [Candidatus Hodarchaeota archaeon]
EGKQLRVYPETSTKIPENQDFDCIVVTTKAFDLKTALLSIQQAKLSKIPIFILQNGYGNEDLARKILPKSSILRAITTEGAYSPTLGQVIRAGVGRTVLGYSKFSNIQKNLSLRLSTILSSAGIPTTVTDTILPWVWAKLLVNAAINPICALIGCKNGYILESKDLRELIEKLVFELNQLIIALKIDLPFTNLENEVIRVLQETSENHCSMLQDIMANRRTEIEFLNLAISELAETNGILTLINNSLATLILGREKANITTESS